MTDLDCEESIQRYHGLLVGILRDVFGVEDTELIDLVEHRLGYREITAGCRLFVEGDTADDIFFVLSGRLRASRATPEGGRVILGDIARGELAGELSLATGARTRSATIIAMRDAVVARLKRSDFEAVLMSRPRVALTMMRTLLERQRRDAADAKVGVGAMKRASNLFLTAISPAVDIEGFAERLAAELPGTNILRVSDFTSAFGPSSEIDADRFRSWLREKECGAERLLLLGCDNRVPQWDLICATHADECLLVGNGLAQPHLSAVEHALDGERVDIPRTLVLCHASDLKTPTGTSRWFAERTIDRHFHVRMERAGDTARLARQLAGRATGLVLSGGGARGFAHVGAMAAMGGSFDRFGGTSIGSVFSALAAIGLDAEAIDRVGRRIFLRRGGPTNDYNLLPMVSLVKGRKAESLTESAIVEELGTSIEIEDMWCPWFAVAAHYATGAETVFTRGPLARSILASLAIPGALPPMVVGGELYVDGGTVNNLPVDVMKRMGADHVTAVDLAPDIDMQVDYDWVPTNLQLLRDRLRRKANRRYAVPRLSEILLNAAMLHSRDHQTAMRHLADRCIRPDVAGIRMLDWKRYDEVVDRGRHSVAVTKAA